MYGAILLSNNQKFYNGEIAYWSGEKYWGKGYGTEAAKALIEFAFQEKKLPKVFARISSLILHLEESCKKSVWFKRA